MDTILRGVLRSAHPLPTKLALVTGIVPKFSPTQLAAESMLGAAVKVIEDQGAGGATGVPADLVRACVVS